MTVVAGVSYYFDDTARLFVAPGRAPLGSETAAPFTPYVTVPDETNSGYQPALIDGTYSGPTTITTAGTIIRNKIINDRLIINAANCGTDNCLVQSVGTQASQMQVDTRAASASGFTAYRTTFKPATLNPWTNSIAGHDWIMERCVVDSTVDGWSPQNSVGAGTIKSTNAQVRFSVLKQLAWFSDDPARTDGTGTHNDGMQLHNGAFVRITGSALHGYKYNALGTPPLDSSADKFYPQISQIFLAQHTIGYVPGYTSGERALDVDDEGFPIISTWGGAPLIDHNWIWGGANGMYVKSDVSFGSQSGQKVDIAVWILGNTWMDYPRVTTGTTFPYPIRIDTNTYLNGSKFGSTTGRGWYETTSPAFNDGNVYSFDTSIPSQWRGKPVGVRVDSAAASVARA